MTDTLLNTISQWWQTATDAIVIDAGKLSALLRYDPMQPLLFNTGLFLVLFVAFMLLYRGLKRWRAGQMLAVIAFSLYFYYKSSYTSCLILLGVCLMDYCLGLLMGKASRNWARRLIVLANVLINVGMLVYFKYLNLIVETIADFATLTIDPLDIVLPAGISFFTFRSISYIVDLYRREMEPCKSLLDYTFYLTYFPPLLAGPVVRAKDMLPQIRGSHVATRLMVSEGLMLIVAGLVKKVIVADYISGNFVDRIFDNPSLYSGLENLLGIYGFLIQLYCDFSGYSDMAIGLALLMGFRFKDNFRAPFKSQSPTEFWRRWHITLSTWLRDYVYIPMGGNRCGKLRTYFNKFMTMVIGGLWHGASWMYMIWGALQGVLLVGHNLLRKIPGVDRTGKPKSWWRMTLNVLITFNLMAFTFVFFRMRSLEGIEQMFHQIVYDFHGNVAWQFVTGYSAVVAAMALGYLLHFLPTQLNAKTQRAFHTMPFVMQALVLALIIVMVIQVRSAEIVPFIYLQY